MSLPVLRPSYSIENIQWNFDAVLGALGEVGLFLPLSGGTVSGDLNVTGALTVDSVAVATTATTYSQTQADARYALLGETAVADLDQTISGTYSQSQVQAISDKVDELLAALRASGTLPTPT